MIRRLALLAVLVLAAACTPASSPTDGLATDGVVPTPEVTPGLESPGESPAESPEESPDESPEAS